MIDPNFPQSSVPTCILGYYLRLSYGSLQEVASFNTDHRACFCASDIFSKKDEEINLMRMSKNFFYGKYKIFTVF